MTIKCRLSTIMGERRFKIADVAKGTGIHRSVISRYYKDQGIDMMSKKVLDPLCEFLKVQPGDLLIWEKV